jgi:hypothetical protein
MNNDPKPTKGAVRVETVTVLNSPDIRCAVTRDLLGEIGLSDIASGRWTSSALTRDQLVLLGESALTAAAPIDQYHAPRPLARWSLTTIGPAGHSATDHLVIGSAGRQAEPLALSSLAGGVPAMVANVPVADGDVSRVRRWWSRATESGPAPNAFPARRRAVPDRSRARRDLDAGRPFRCRRGSRPPSRGSDRGGRGVDVGRLVLCAVLILAPVLAWAAGTIVYERQRRARHSADRPTVAGVSARSTNAPAKAPEDIHEHRESVGQPAPPEPQVSRLPRGWQWPSRDPDA